jgi:hypothetical protein
MPEILTREMLEAMTAGAIIAKGETVNSPDGVYMTDQNIGAPLKFVAKRGGFRDWAIYVDWAYKSDEDVLKMGQKVFGNEHIKKLVPCDEEALKMYRK